ncbi:MAG: DUF2604 domain-containing protein [Actinomycetota bacterium]|nr:DUF2604 domain-containing protein [Actinomycetota bacterium]
MPQRDDNEKEKDKKVQLEVVVNGQATSVQANANAPLHTIIPKALEQTGNAGQPPENWELRDQSGVLLPLETKIEDFNFRAGTKLFLNLKAGVGGQA